MASYRIEEVDVRVCVGQLVKVTGRTARVVGFWENLVMGCILGSSELFPIEGAVRATETPPYSRGELKVWATSAPSLT